MKKLIVGNWKMNGTAEHVAEWANFDPVLVLEKAELVICPSAVYFTDLAIHLSEDIAIGAQDCSIRTDDGAFTGEVSAKMLGDIGCDYVILGHSERRLYNNETNAIIHKKAENAINAHLTAIICVGETLNERENGKAQDIVKQQILEAVPSDSNDENTVIAYEPVWAIGTGKVASPEDVQTMHAFIRGLLKEKLDNGGAIRILYGGSVKASNAGELLALPDVDGALVGGASLDQTEFLNIAKSAR
jgi:triosephosphate isomerase (TIM)